MARITSLLSTAAIIVMSATTFASAQDRVVNVYNWSDYIDESILEEFTKETGIQTLFFTCHPHVEELFPENAVRIRLNDSAVECPNTTGAHAYQ